MSFELLIDEKYECEINLITCNEDIDVSILLKLIHSDLLLSNFNNPFCKSKFENEKEQLIKYYLNINEKQLIPVKYKKVEGMGGYGRVFPEHSLGLYSIRRQIRHTLAKNKYIDMDIKNCHFEILYQLCKQRNVYPVYLKKYIVKREKYINCLMNTYLININDINKRKDMAKQLFIRILYYGSFDKWLEENKLEYNEEFEYINNFIKELSRELGILGHKIIKDNSKLDELVKIKKEQKSKDLSYNRKGSVVSYYLQEYENRILECIYKFLSDKKIIDIYKNDCVLCADGIMIIKNKFYDGLLEELMNEIKTKFDFDLTLITKAMDEDYLDKLDNHIIDNDVYLFYELKKIEFEKTHFKLMNPTTFAEIMNDESVLLRNQSNFLTAYNHLHYKYIKEYKNKEAIYEKSKFIKKWIDDDKLKIYNKMDFLPKMKCPDNVYNTFSGFNVEKINIEEDKNIIIDNTLIYKHIENLCNNDKVTIKYFINYLALKVQKPYKVVGTSLIFKSGEGVGKDSFFDWFGKKILGAKYYLNEDNIDLIFGHFNSCIENKLLVVINETSGSDTFSKVNRIKNAITREVNIIERKGLEAYENKNNISYIFLTNNDVVMKIDANERRFICIECDSSNANNKIYFDNLYNEFNDDNYIKAFYNYLINIDLTTFDFIKERPETNFYKSLREHNIPIFLKFIEDEYIKSRGKSEESYNDLFIDFNYYLQGGNFKYDTNRIKFGCDIKKYDFIEKIRKEKGFKYYIDFNKFKKYMIKNKYEIDFIE